MTPFFFSLFLFLFQLNGWMDGWELFARPKNKHDGPFIVNHFSKEGGTDGALGFDAMSCLGESTLPCRL